MIYRYAILNIPLLGIITIHSRTFLCGLPRENVEVGVKTLCSLHALLLPRGLLQLDRAQLLHADRHRRLGR